MESVHISSWWRNRMETFSELLAVCEGNPSVTGGFPSQRPVARSFDVFFDLHLNDAWANTRDAGDLRRHRAHYDVTVIYSIHTRNDIGAANNACRGLSTFSYTPFAKSNGRFFSDIKINMMPLSNLYDFRGVRKMHARVHFRCKIYWILALTRSSPGF